MKIAVTGASGHVGTNLIPALLSAGHQVRILGHTNFSLLSDYKVPMIKGDLLDIDSLFEFVDGADVVIHLAAKITMDKKSPETLKINIDGTKNMLHVAKKSGVSRFIHFSSIHSYNPFPLTNILNENSSLNIDSEFDYDKSKAITEQFVLESNEADFNTVVLNPSAIVGPNDHKPSTLGMAIIQMYKGKIPALLNGGYNWVDVRDVVEGTINALRLAKPGNAYLLTGHWRSMFELASEISVNGGKPPPKWCVPFWLAKMGAGILNVVSNGSSDDKIFSATSLETLKNSPKFISYEKAAVCFNYHPRPFSDTIKDVINWYKENELI